MIKITAQPFGAASNRSEIVRFTPVNDNGIIPVALTTEPQLYTGNFIQENAAPHGKGGVRYPRFGGICPEAQHYPCSPNYPEFLLLFWKRKVCRQKTVYQFLNCKKVSKTHQLPPAPSIMRGLTF